MIHSTTNAPQQDLQYVQATGKMSHTLMNDYLFKALLQKNETVLRHLICSLLHLRPEQIESVEIRNPILLGAALTEDFDSKTFILDVNVLLNDQTIVNLEMQVIDYQNWPERALTYLCRNFDQLQSGQDYLEAKPVIHIGFLDFTLFSECPEFYATYKLMNVKNHHIFSDKFVLSVVDLRHIELATQEDREWRIDHWASLFKATSWEELKMLAKDSQIMESAVQTIYELTADEAIRYQCTAREKQMKEMNTIIAERAKAFSEREAAIQARDAAFQKREEAFQERDAAFQEREEAFQERDAAFQERDSVSQKLAQQTQILDEQQRINAEQAWQLKQLQEELERLKIQSGVER
ncbi:MAG: Rpn family recombination-promoting nuclease/putative transposase [bacterium]|nr:Rpn family recombination-promoting nuclease/putative transposase [bacterium]MCM1374736.1 Rpn family recombination-promoting nuclease/putative transposase [Muribaculum sp.]